MGPIVDLTLFAEFLLVLVEPMVAVRTATTTTFFSKSHLEPRFPPLNVWDGDLHDGRCVLVTGVECQVNQFGPESVDGSGKEKKAPI
jgi:hypothetical protein